MGHHRPARLPVQAALAAGLAVACVASTGCLELLVVIVSPFFPGLPAAPPPDLSCPALPRDEVDPGPLPEGPLAPAPLAALPSQCDVGRAALHRLNRFEYDRTVQDLTGLAVRPADAFPADDSGYGFDNNADALATAPLLVEKYEAAAREVAHAMLARPDEERTIRTYEAERAISDDGYLVGETAYAMDGAGRVLFLLNLPVLGEYDVGVRVRGANPVELALVKNGERVATMTAPEDDEVLVQTVVLGGKPDWLAVQVDEPNGQVVVDFIEIDGPVRVLQHADDPPARRRVLTCDPDDLGRDACATRVLGAFASRAWRRPATREEAARLRALHQAGTAAGDTFEEALETGLAAVLLSPSFLFRVELDEDPTSTAPHALDDHALAARLSYFLWSSMPDDRLREIADRGALKDKDVLAAEARRMIADPKARALAENFGSQWLQTRGLDDAAPDPQVFAGYDEQLKAAMACETTTFFDSLIVEDRPIMDLVEGDTTFVNGRLADHYGIDGAPDAGWTEVSLDGIERRGVLGHASILTVTSYPTRTSPARRGKFVLDQLLCLPPSPPPPDVEGIPPEAIEEEGKTLREVFEQHRSDPACAACHETIDPFGFALERYDGIGAVRETDNGAPIDDSGLYFYDTPFHGPVELAHIMADDPQVTRCIVEKTMSYALGRGIGPGDACAVDDVTSVFTERGRSTRDLFVLIATSDVFRARRGEGGAP